MKKPLAIVLLLIGGAALKLALSAASIHKDTERKQQYEPENRTTYQKH